MKEYLKNVLSLGGICAAAALLLGVTYKYTAPMIEKNESAGVTSSLSVVLPQGENFTPADTAGTTLPESVREVYTEDGGGVVVKLEVAGYAPGMVILCGIDSEGKVVNSVCLGSSETLGEEKTFGENFSGITLQDVDSVDTVSGATRTTTAYKGAVKDALGVAASLSGESVDLRDEEEKLRENLSTALPSADGSFTKVFLTERLEGVDSVYSAGNGTGRVFVFGDAYVGVDGNGKVVSEGGEVYQTKVKEYFDLLENSRLTELDLSKYDELYSGITEAYLTDSGNGVFYVKAAGFGINGNKWYSPSGEYITLRVCIGSEGVIIDCETLTQKETEGVGSVCADEEFYSRFVGEDRDGIGEVDAVSGATVTSDGYKRALVGAFEAFDIIKGNKK